MNCWHNTSAAGSSEPETSVWVSYNSSHIIGAAPRDVDLWPPWLLVTTCDVVWISKIRMWQTTTLLFMIPGAENVKNQHVIIEVWVCWTCSTRPGRQKSRFYIKSTSLDSASQIIQIINSLQIVAGLGRAAGCFSLGAQTGQRFITGCATMSCDSHRSKLGQ